MPKLPTLSPHPPRKMTADKIVLLERQCLRNRILEAAGLARLSLFYL